MATQTEIKAQIEAIEAKLNLGLKSVRNEDTASEFDLEELRRQRSYLIKQLNHRRRPASARIDLGGF